MLLTAYICIKSIPVNYYQLTIPIPQDEIREQLIALLSEQGFEGFEEDETILKAFIPETDYREQSVKDILVPFGLDFTSLLIAQQNWNAQWESGFEPVIVGDFCTIRAHFHTAPVHTRHDIIITPKMSFGTGHHATTRLMVEQMEQMDFNGKQVLDFGTGTGVLAILAEKLGAADVLGIDNDEWSFENAQENTGMNHCQHTRISMDDIGELLPAYRFDIIVANINRHILLQYMQTMHELVNENGILLMSGLLTEDEQIIRESAVTAGFKVQEVNMLNNWITIRCTMA